MAMNDKQPRGAKLTSLWEVLSSPPPPNTHDLWKEHQQLRTTLDSVSTTLTSDQQQEGAEGRAQFIEPFVNWAEQHNIEGLGIVEICESSKGGLCLKARREIVPDEIPIKVPHEALLSADYAEKCHTLKAILENDQMLQAMDNVALVMVLAHEVLRAGKSDWRPYLQLLPSAFSTPLFYSLDDFQSLKPSPAFHEAMLIYRAVARQYVYFSLRILSDYRWLKEQKKRAKRGKEKLSVEEQAKEAPFSLGVFTESNFTLQLYRWCVSVVSTRINMVPTNRVRGDCNAAGVASETLPVKMIPALIPLVDLANHEYSPNGERPTSGSVYFDSPSGEVRLQTRTHVKTHDEVLIHYGERSNSEFLIHNGFVPNPPNEGNSYQLRIPLPKSTSDFDRKLQLLGELNLKRESASTTFVIALRLPPPIDVRDTPLWALAKALVSKSVDDLAAENGNNADSALDAKAKKFLKDRLELLLKSYGSPPKLESDVQRNIQRLKAGEVEILKAYVEQVFS